MKKFFSLSLLVLSMILFLNSSLDAARNSPSHKITSKELRFTQLNNFSGGLYQAYQGNKFGYINKQGKIVIPIHFNGADSPFSKDGTAVVSVVINKWLYTGLINSSGKYIIKPQKHCFNGFQEGLMPLYTEQNGYGYIDRTGQWVIKPKYTAVENFRENKAFVVINGKYGVIDRKGKLIIPPKFEEASVFHNGFAVVRLNNKLCFIDIKGKPLFDPNLNFDCLGEFEEGLAPVQLNGKYGYMDTTGKLIIAPQYDNASPFSKGRAFVYTNGKGRIINKQNQLLTDPKINILYGDNLYLGEDENNLMGFWDLNGHEVFQRRFARAQEFSEGLAAVSPSGKWLNLPGAGTSGLEGGCWGFIDLKGNLVIPPKFDEVQNFHDGMAVVKVKDKYGYINKQGNMVIPPQFDLVGEFQSGTAVISIGGRWDLIDKTGKLQYK